MSLLTSFAIALAAAVGCAQASPQKPPSPGTSEFHVQFEKAWRSVREGDDPAESTALRSVVEGNPMVATMALAALDAHLDPEMSPATRSERVAMARAMARILGREQRAPELLAIVERSAAWSEEERVRYWRAVHARQQAKELRKTEPTRSRELFEDARAVLTGLQRSDQVAAIDLELSLILYYERDLAGAVRVLQPTIERLEQLGDSYNVARHLTTLGLYYKQNSQLDQSLAAHRRALPIYEAIGNDTLLFKCLARIGDRCVRIGEFEEAIRCHERALRLGGDDLGRYGVLSFNAYCHQKLQHTDEAVRDFELAVALARKLGDKYVIDPAGRLGQIYVDQQKPALALQLLDEAAGLAKKLGDTKARAFWTDKSGLALRDLGEVAMAAERHRQALALMDPDEGKSYGDALTNLGNATYSLGRYDEAVEYHRAALELRKKLGNQLDIAGSHNNIGNVLSSRNEAESALDHYETALRIKLQHGGSKHDLFSAYTNLSRVYTSLRLTDRARRSAEEALELATNGKEIALARQELATTFMTDKQWDHAKASIDAAIEALAEHPDRLLAGQLLQFRAVIELALGDAETSISRLRAALDSRTLVQNPHHLSEVHFDLGQAYFASGKDEEALEHWEKARGIAVEQGFRTEIDCEFKIAQALCNLKRPAQARSHLEAALAALGTRRSTVWSERSRVGFTGSYADYLERSLAVALQHEGADADPHLATRLLEALRGFATAESLQAVTSSLRPRASAANATALRQIEREIDVLLAKRSDDPEARSESTKALAGLEHRWNDVLARIAREDPEFAQMRRPHPIGLAELQANLPEDTAFVAFALGEEGSLLLVVDSAGLTSFRLPRAADIERDVNRYLALLSDRPRPATLAQIVTSGRELFRSLLEPCFDRLRGVRHLLVSADGALRLLPFACLIVPSPEPDLDRCTFLVQSHAITYVHSATSWNILREAAVAKRQARGTDRDMLILADPVGPDERGTASDEQLVLRLGRERGTLGRLPSTRTEALEIATQFLGGENTSWHLRIADGEKREVGGADVVAAVRAAALKNRHILLSAPHFELRLGNFASRRAVLEHDALDRFRFLHFAAHGVVHPTSPGLSSLVLSSSGDDSGRLKLIDVQNLRLGADLVVLSACNSQLGKSMAGEGLQSLVRSFLYAGAENVIASSWRVPDAATAELLPAVYQSIRTRGDSAAQALRHAQISYLAAALTPKSRSPYYWGAWMAWGSGLRIARR